VRKIGFKNILFIFAKLEAFFPKPPPKSTFGLGRGAKTIGFVFFVLHKYAICNFNISTAVAIKMTFFTNAGSCLFQNHKKLHYLGHPVRLRHFSGGPDLDHQSYLFRSKKSSFGVNACTLEKFYPDEAASSSFGISLMPSKNSKRYSFSTGKPGLVRNSNSQGSSSFLK